MHHARFTPSAHVHPSGKKDSRRKHALVLPNGGRRKQWAALMGTALVLCLLPLMGCQALRKKPAGSSANAATSAAATGGAKPSKLTATARVGPASGASAGMPATGMLGVRRATKETRVGEVRVIGAGRRFVLIEVLLRTDLPTLSPGVELRSRSLGASTGFGGEETAILQVSPERRQPFIVADVTGGEPHVGDPVYYSAENQHAPLPSFLLSPAPEPPSTPVVLPPPPAAASSTTTSTTGGYRATATVHPMGE